jgi:hypothetical protein
VPDVPLLRRPPVNWFQSDEERIVSPSFKPPAGGSLAEVDVADVAYDDRCVVIEGVVSPRGQGGWAGRSADYDVHHFTLAGWRRQGEPLVERDLTLLRPVPPARAGQPRAEDIFERFPAYSIQRISVLLSQDRTRAVVEKSLPIDLPDRELVLFAERLRQPVVIPTERFGDLVLNPTVNWLEGKADWNGKVIEITFAQDEGEELGELLKTAESLWSAQAAWKRRVDDFAVRELLPLKNDAWLGDGEAELTPADFQARMQLVSISIGGDGRFEFWHDDGDLFGGHAIEIRGNLKDGLMDAGIAG